MSELTEATWERLRKLFPPEQHQEVAALLLNECSNNLPFCRNSDAYELERIHFAVLKLSEGNLKELQQAVALAQVDWRDVLMAAGFGHSVTAHQTWFVT